MEQKYGALRTYIVILNILAWILIIATVIATFGIMATGMRGSGAPALTMLIGGILGGIACLAFAQFLKVIIDIEEGIRKLSFNLTIGSNTVSTNSKVENSETEIEVSGTTWKCPKCWHSNQLPIGACSYCSYGH